MTDQTAEEWLAEHHPDQPPLPTDDTGRKAGQVEFTDENVYYELAVHPRPNTRRNTAGARIAALESQSGELTEREANRQESIQFIPTSKRCHHCHRNRMRTSRLCNPCYVYRLRNDRLPDNSVLANRR